MNQSAQPQTPAKIVTSQPLFRLPRPKIFLPLLLVLVLIFGGLGFGLNRYGKFWEKKPALTNLTSTPTPASQPTKISCPVPQEFCGQAKVVDEGEGFFGIYFNLPLETPILAIVAGEVEDKTKSTGRAASHPLLHLKDALGYEVIYSYYGTTSVRPGAKVLAGTEIGKIGKGVFPAVAPFGGTNFLLSLKKDGKFISITFEDFNK